MEKNTEALNPSEILAQAAEHTARTSILMQIREVRETTSIEEVAQLLSSGHWIAICATPKEPYLFSMGRFE